MASPAVQLHHLSSVQCQLLELPASLLAKPEEEGVPGIQEHHLVAHQVTLVKVHHLLR